ncbi:MAG: potassium channel protein [Actinobacteria bacterium]|nr:MAG: potassium channel protein [Actinomycetota bacterium]TMM28293.1 MAG: potassium channel protein [Actinomycetota bacterium]
MESFSPRRIGYALAALAAVLAIGTVGYRWSLGESWLQSFYRAVVTSALVGLDTVPRNDSARLLSIFMVFAGVTIFAFVASTLVESIARGVLTGALAEKRRRRAIENLRDHYIICGYGRVGQQIGSEFRAAGAQYVVVDFHEDALGAARERNDYFIEGDGTDEDDLDAAGLARARGLVASSDSDADNLYITLSARAVRPDLLVVARASNAAAAKKLRIAGADRVVQPYSAAGRVMANLMLKPQVTAFIDVVTSAAGADLRFEELEVPAGWAQAGKTIGELRIRGKTGAVIVAVRKRDGHFETTPDPDLPLEAGDVMIAAGTDEELRALEELFRSAEAIAGR